MAEDIRFSVVIAAYNAAETITRAVSSALSQSLKPHEVIVVDDGSKDSTVALLQQQFGENVRVLKLEKNAGPSAARNAGMDAARGEYIAFLDADDWWMADKLRFIHDAIVEHPNVRFVFHSYALKPEVVTERKAVKRFGLWKLLLRNRIATPCAVVVNDAALRFDPQLRWMEDWDFFLRAAERYGAWQIDVPLTVLGRPVLAPGGLSASRRKMRLGEMRVYVKWAASRPHYLLALPFLLLLSAVKAAAKCLR